jgi:hypothetical protein
MGTEKKRRLSTIARVADADVDVPVRYLVGRKLGHRWALLGRRVGRERRRRMHVSTWVLDRVVILALIFLFSNTHTCIYITYTKNFGKDFGYSNEYPWIQVGPPLLGDLQLRLDYASCPGNVPATARRHASGHHRVRETAIQWNSRKLPSRGDKPPPETAPVRGARWCRIPPCFACCYRLINCMCLSFDSASLCVLITGAVNVSAPH